MSQDHVMGWALLLSFVLAAALSTLVMFFGIIAVAAVLAGLTVAGFAVEFAVFGTIDHREN